jgi:transposase-like protein
MAAYQIMDRSDRRALAEFLQKEGQFLLPMVELIESSQQAVDELIDVTGRATIEAVLALSAQGLAGPKHPGKEVGSVRWHGRQNGLVSLSDRKVRVSKPRLRRKGPQGGEVEVPAYTALRQRSDLGSRMLQILMRGVSTRNYEAVVPEMADTVGVSKSSVSREVIAASAETLRELAERRFDEVDILIIYIDGLVFGDHRVVAAIGIDPTGKKHVLGLKDGASENAVVAQGLLEDLVARGVAPGRRRLFVIDGAKALRKAIDSVFGQDNPVQRCRRHKERNVMGYLPEDDRRRMLQTMKAAWKLPAAEGEARLEKEAKALEKVYPSAAVSLREGLAEMFTVSRLGLPTPLQRCLCSTNVIESSFSGTRGRTRRVTHWQSGDMALRWAASALVETAKQFRRIMGHQYLWMLETCLKDQEMIAKPTKVG